MGIISAIHIIAERRIEEAIRDGKLKVDGWRNKPLPPDNDRMVPADLKMAYKILKNSGYLPPEIETRNEISKLEELIASTEDEHQRVKQLKKLNFLTMKLNQMRPLPCNLEKHEDYYRKVTEKISLGADSKKTSQGDI